MRAHIYASIADNKKISVLTIRRRRWCREAIVWNNSIAYICAQSKRYITYTCTYRRDIWDFWKKKKKTWKSDVERKKRKYHENIAVKAIELPTRLFYKVFRFEIQNVQISLGLEFLYISRISTCSHTYPCSYISK